MIKNNRFCLFFIFVATLLIGKHAFASSTPSTIEGVWKHATKPAFIEFNLKTGIARVKEHQTHKQNSGLTIIKNITHSPVKENEWTGEMFNGYQNKYVSVTIKLKAQFLAVFDAENREVLKLFKE